MHVRQGKALGLGHAVLCAKPLVGDEPFAVVLPDVILDEYTADQTKYNLKAMVDRFNETKISQIMVAPVPMEDVSKYGVVDIFNQSIQEGDHMEITAVVEKPSIESAPSNLSVVGRYVLSNRIWKMLELTPVGAGNEIQLSDAIDLLLEQRTVEAYHMVGESHDCKK